MMDVKYIRERDSLIPNAEVRANKEIDRLRYRSEDEYRAAWNKSYHRWMNQLWRETHMAGK